MHANITDRWTKPDPNWTPTSGEKRKRVRTARYGTGLRWLAEWTSPNGKRHRRSFETKAAAEAHLADQSTDQRRGTYVAPNRTTVGDLWPKFRTVKSTLARSTREMYASAWTGYVEERWAHVPVSDIDRAAVLEWIPTLRKQPTPTQVKEGVPGGALSASWAKKVAITLGGILDLAVDGKLLAANPLNKIGKALPKQLPTDRRYLDVAEVDALLVAADDRGIGLPVRVLLMTGVRRGEMAGIQVRDVDLSRGRIRISRDIDNQGEVDATKTRKHRDVPIGGELLKLIREAVKDRARDDWLLPTDRGGPWTRDAWRRRWAGATKTAQLAGYDTHELRHTAASIAIHSGANVKTIQNMLGHATAAMTLDIYGHLWDDALDQLPTAMYEHLDRERQRAKDAAKAAETADEEPVELAQAG